MSCVLRVCMMKKTQKIRPWNKVFLSGGLILASAVYAILQYGGNASITVASAVPAPVQNQTTPSASHIASRMYTDGTYTGSAADAYYGTIQVKAVVQNGKLATVQFLQHPSGRSTSRSINGRAMPILASEAIQAQGSSVDIVSGATFSSQAFEQSLHFALTQAQV